MSTDDGFTTQHVSALSQAQSKPGRRFPVLNGLAISCAGLGGILTVLSVVAHLTTRGSNWWFFSAIVASIFFVAALNALLWKLILAGRNPTLTVKQRTGRTIGLVLILAPGSVVSVFSLVYIGFILTGFIDDVAR
jgi:protein-S-isoprenylcysteine O-methyltransferase Ste14